MLAHVPSFGRNPRGSTNFLAYPVPKACMHVPGSGVPRCLGVARSASSPKAAQALGCSLNPGLRVTLGRVNCMAQAASVPGLWTLGLLLLCCACVRVSLLRPAHQSWLGSRMRVFGYGFWPRPANPCWGLWCVCLGLGLACTPAILAGVLGCLRSCACFARTAPFLAGACGGCVRARVYPAYCGSVVWCGLRLWLHPTNPGWGVGTCVFMCALPLYPASPGWGVRCGCLCFG